MRCDQHAGITPEARKFLAENEFPGVTCPLCGCSKTGPKLDEIGRYIGMFEDEFPLFRHHLKNGDKAEEFLQAAPWSSGPVHFIGLRIFHIEGDKAPVLVREFRWSEEEIAEA